jgi:hypothetical protein
VALSWSRILDADHEQPGLIRRTDHFVAIDHDRSICFNRDAHKPGFDRQSDGARTDRWPVGAPLLTGFLDFDQNAAQPFAAECRAASYQLVSAFYRFDAEHEALLNYDSLANVEGAQGPSDAQPVLDIPLGLRIRLDDAERAGMDDLTIKELIGTYEPKTLLFQFVDDGRQQAIVAKGTIAYASKQLGRPPIGAQCDQRWTADTAG